ncbi:dienelactone hydrolase family protein [Saccharomonospora xinjiangensis]|uniref:Dienelactone hydrolase-like enzyme n=1 Tax=Saccharomonospora xinjiangensis XJ-54 TaxID=882086 RepID=I0UXJ8_9PSEU|nr:alpha/beta fold hydrolase [Saccharomonospora xinjiangensis]EID52601.1 dienelactone hydrolase-like enzyme [Saccharomonospora xinjiangensis XJ-54]
MTVPFGVAAGTAALSGDLTVPSDALGVVAFAHGSGSSRHSPRNVAVARSLQDRRLATLLFDLLSREEERRDAATGELRFDIGLLADRLVNAVDQLGEDATTRALPIGLFGASTGAAAALVAAARRPELVRAVVSRGGRPDLADDALPDVECPTLLVVGGADTQVQRLNEQAASRLSAPHELRIVPNATHLFEEPGALEAVADLAGEWFTRHLPR